jgi:hypothetical protein
LILSDKSESYDIKFSMNGTDLILNRTSQDYIINVGNVLVRVGPFENTTLSTKIEINSNETYINKYGLKLNWVKVVTEKNDVKFQSVLTEYKEANHYIQFFKDIL